MRHFLTMLRRIDWILFLSVVTLSGLGLLAIWSVDIAQDPGRLFNFKKQLAFVVVGCAVALIAACLNYRTLRSMSRGLYIAGLILLIAVLFFGTTVRGTKGWFTILGATVQPVELIKVILIVVLAKYFSERAHIVDLKVLFNLSILTGLYAALTLAQPDFGSALVLIGIAVGMLLLTNVPRRYVISGALIGCMLAVVGWGFFLKDYQKDRVRSFIDPQADPFGRGYNIRQSVIAVGAGGLFGRGLGEGSQSQLRFLPEAQTDFIFAVIAEELGFVGAVMVLALYLVLLFQIVRVALCSKDEFGSYVVLGIGLLFFIQIVFNLGAATGLLPVTGLTLPFVSYGGSSLIVNLLLIGIVESVHKSNWVNEKEGVLYG